MKENIFGWEDRRNLILSINLMSLLHIAMMINDMIKQSFFLFFFVLCLLFLCLLPVVVHLLVHLLTRHVLLLRLSLRRTRLHPVLPHLLIQVIPILLLILHLPALVPAYPLTPAFVAPPQSSVAGLGIVGYESSRFWVVRGLVSSEWVFTIGVVPSPDSRIISALVFVSHNLNLQKNSKS